MQLGDITKNNSDKYGIIMNYTMNYTTIALKAKKKSSKAFLPHNSLKLYHNNDSSLH